MVWTLCPASEVHRPREKKANSTEWQGAIGLFTNADHISRIQIEPKCFAPRLGGYCALAAQFGEQAHSNPKVFHVRDGKL